MKKLSSGFSLTELLVVVAIVGIISSISISYYSEYKVTAHKVNMKHELSGVMKALEYAYSVDGAYHQKIHTANYKPNRVLITEVGFDYDKSDNICCSGTSTATESNIFPTSAELTARPNLVNKFFTLSPNIYNSTDTTNPDSATRATHICETKKFCKILCKYIPDGKGVSSCYPTVPNYRVGLAKRALTGCRNDFNNKEFKCKCNEYRIFARSYLNGKELLLFANEKGLTCAPRKDRPTTLKPF